MLKMYKPGPLDIFIENTYREKGIIFPSDLTVKNLAEKFNIVLITEHPFSLSIWDNEFSVIFLEEKLTELEIKIRLMHELGHVLRHNFSELDMPNMWNNYYELDAERFALACAIPYYMLRYLEPNELMYPQKIAEIFNIPLESVIKRIQIILNHVNLPSFSQTIQNSKMKLSKINRRIT